MIQRLTETFLQGVELIEAEGRLARHHFVGAITGIVLVSCLILLSLLGLALLLTGVILTLQISVGLAASFLIVGSLAGGSAAAGAFFIYQSIRAEKETPQHAESPAARPGKSPQVGHA